jgi:CBS domain-containing protein
MELIKVARVPAITAKPTTTVLEAAALMASENVGAIVVVDEDKRVLGMFTERDNLMRVTRVERDPRKTLLEQVMTSEVTVVAPDTTVNDGLDLMIRNRYRHLPIVNSKRVILGIASLRYLLMRRISDKQATVEALAAYVQAGGPG